MDQCNICGKFGWSSSHRCPPEWECTIQPDGYSVTVRGMDEEYAAEEAAELMDPMHYLLENPGGCLIEVRRSDGAGAAKRFRVKAEASVDYHAEEES